MSLEAKYGNKPTESDEIWSYGCTLVYIFSGITPYSDRLEAEWFNDLLSKKLPDELELIKNNIP